jgi:hypothetical protein
MGLITWIIICVVILAIIGLGWNVFLAGVKKGADKVGLTSIINQAKQSFSAKGQIENDRRANEYQNGYKAGVYDAQHSSSEAVDGTNRTKTFRDAWVKGYCSTGLTFWNSTCLEAATELAASVHHKDFSMTKDCMRTDKIDGFWIADKCNHQPLPVAVATIKIICNNGTCKSTGWIPIDKNTNKSDILK